MSAEKCQNGGISRDSAAGNDNISFGVADMYFLLVFSCKNHMKPLCALHYL